MLSAARSHAAKNNISESKAFSELMDKSSNNKIGVGFNASLNVDSDKQVLGKVAGFATGISAKGDIHTNGDQTWSKGSSDNIQKSSTAGHDNSSDKTSQEAKDFREGMDTLKSFRASQSGSHSDNSASSQLEQLGTTLSVADSQYQQYTNSMTRSHEYSQMASSAETTTAQTQSNYAQEFVGYVQNKSPEKAEAILTDTASPEVRAEREQLAGQFMEDKLRSRVDEHFNSSKGQLSNGMSSVSNTATTSGDNAYQHGQQEIASRSESAGIRSDNANRVDTMIDEGKHRISDKDMEINTVKSGINNDRASLIKEQSHAERGFGDSYGKAIDNQGKKDPGFTKAEEKINSASKKIDLK
jgi:conjugal transfer mating pair stabilization protein TraG